MASSRTAAHDTRDVTDTIPGCLSGSLVAGDVCRPLDEIGSEADGCFKRLPCLVDFSPILGRHFFGGGGSFHLEASLSSLGR